MTLTNEYQYVGRSNAVKDQNGKYSYYILLYAKTSPDEATGRHRVSVKQRLVGTNVFYGYSTSGSISIAGTEATQWSWAIVPGGNWNLTNVTEGGVTYARGVDLKEGTMEIDVGYGTEKSIQISASWRFESGSAGYLPQTAVTATVTGTVTLPVIYGASTISAVAEATLGFACNVKWTPRTAAMRYKLKFAVGEWSHTTGVIHPNQTEEYTYMGYVLPLEIAQQIPNSAFGVMTATLYTYSDSSANTQVGAEDTKIFTAKIPDNESTKPSVEIVSLTAQNGLEAPFDGMFIQGKSKVCGSFAGSGKYGASISDYTMTVEGKSYNGAAELTSDYISGYGSITVKVTVTDSRGFSTEKAEEIFAAAYAKPKITVSQCQRCDGNGNITDSGTYLRIVAERIYNTVDTGGGQTNFCDIRYRFRTENSSFGQWRELLAGADTASNKVDSGALLGSFAVDTTYVVQIGVADTLGGQSESEYTIMSEAVFLHERAGGKGLGIGKYCEEDNLVDIAFNVRVRGDIIVGDGMTLEEYIKSLIN